MKKIQAIGIGIIALSLLACSIGLVTLGDQGGEYTVTAENQSEEYVVINAPFSTVEGQGYPIPSGSLIYHSADGITTVYAPDGKPILKARDADAAKKLTGLGLVPATRVSVCPSGSYGTREPIVFHTEDRGWITGIATKNYAPNGTLLLTVESEKEEIW